VYFDIGSIALTPMRFSGMAAHRMNREKQYQRSNTREAKWEKQNGKAVQKTRREATGKTVRDGTEAVRDEINETNSTR